MWFVYHFTIFHVLLILMKFIAGQITSINIFADFRNNHFLSREYHGKTEK
jgi:hypothetical protein